MAKTKKMFLLEYNPTAVPAIITPKKFFQKDVIPDTDITNLNLEIPECALYKVATSFKGDEHAGVVCVNFRGVINPYKSRFLVLDLRVLPKPQFYGWSNWSEENVPYVTPLIQMLVEGTHPFATLGSEFETGDFSGFEMWMKKYIELDTKELQWEVLHRDSETKFGSILRYTYVGKQRANAGKVIPKFAQDFFNVVEQPWNIKKPTTNESVIVTTDPCRIPEISEIQMESDLRYWSKRHCWNYDPPSRKELEDRSEMYNVIMEHCKDLEGFKILSLSKRDLVYMSDGSWKLTPDAISKDVVKSIVKNYDETSPVIYIGEVWSLTFAAGDYKPQVVVNVATPEQYVTAYSNTRPQFAKEFNKSPWGDGVIFICSDWCQRNTAHDYHSGIKLQTPRGRRLSLRTWLRCDFTMYCQRVQAKVPWSDVDSIYTASMEDSKKLQSLLLTKQTYKEALESLVKDLMPKEPENMDVKQADIVKEVKPAKRTTKTTQKTTVTS